MIYHLDNYNKFKEPKVLFMENKKKEFFKFDEKFIETSMKNLKNEEGYENFVEIIKALGKI